MIFVISGPSGCGKSTLVKRVLGDIKDIKFSVSYTTREKKKSENEGEDYYFVSINKFKSMIEDNKLVEWAIVHGNYYGTSRREIEKKGTRNNLLLDLDVQGAQKARERFKKAVFIFILPPGFRELKNRLEKRERESLEDIQRRLKVAQKEIRSYAAFDYIIINDKLDTAVWDLKSIINSQHCRLDLCQKEIIPILRSFSERE
jgi:guanylate kinase